ncbi:MAG: hypothetical protein P4L36_20675 [Holophaga sp.]|nr:hypothetical protein [Holophaga sp.]
MRFPIIHTALILTGGLLCAPRMALADSLPSLIKHTAVASPWTVSLVGGTGKLGKCKIYNVKPVYNDDDDITTKPVRELKEGNITSFTFDRNKDYWIVFFPRVGLVNVELKFTKDKDSKTAGLTVTGINIADKAGIDLPVTFTTTNPKATWEKRNYLKGLGELISGKPAPFIKLD